MKKWLGVLFIAIVTPLLSGCPSNGSSAPPPAMGTSVAGEGRVTVNWTPVSGVDYWLFTATDAALSALNWTGLANSHSYINASSPYNVCGLYAGDTYYFATNGRINGGPGGASSTQVNATPYNAATAAPSIGGATGWVASSVPTTANINSVSYTSLNTCSNNASSFSGEFAMVGNNGAIFTSGDGKSGWSNHTLSTALATDLYAITGYAANQNNLTNPALLWIAVGKGGASFYAVDGLDWNASVPYNAGTAAIPIYPNLNAITHVGGTFFAVGDAPVDSTMTILPGQSIISGGVIISSTDGKAWTSHTPATTVTTNNLRGIAHGTNYVAVGDNGTILTSADGNTWAAHVVTLPLSTTPLTANLKQVASVGNLIVAVGDAGTIVISKDAGATWVVQTLPGAPNLVGVAAESITMSNDVTANLANGAVDGWLGVVPTVQFVAVDSNGNAYATRSNATNTSNLTWSAATSTGTSNINALTSSGFGYVAVGNAGITTSAF